MRILFLSQRVPYPPNRGDKIPTFHYVRHLAQQHEVTVACLADGHCDMTNAEGLRPLVHAVDAVLLSPSRARIRALSALAGRRPLTVAYFDEPELRDRIRRRIMDGQVDAVIVFSSGTAQFVEEFDRLPRIIQFADLDSQKWLQYATASQFPKSWVYHLECNRLLRYERRLAATFTHSLVCAPRECDDFRRLIPGAEVECLPNGVDLEYFQPKPDVDRVSNSLVFTGVMNYRPNVDGVVWFCRDVLPRIRTHVPNVTFTICGSSPDRSLQTLAKEPGVTVTGAVDDVRLYLAKATGAVVPLRIARGIQNKLLEAMAMGVPAVATSAAFAGIEAQAGRDLLVADDPVDFAAAVVKLLSDPATRESLSRSGRAAVEAAYCWDHTLERLNEIVTSVGNHHQNGALNSSSA